jgi:putative MFS transporter
MEAAALAQAVLGLLSCVSYEYHYFLAIRFLFGVGIGVVFPLSGTYLTEISPVAHRTITLGWSRIFFSLGAVFSCLISWLFLHDDVDIDQSGWRLVMILSTLPGAAGFILLKTQGF